jgi:predicted enzyme related to lactoylglutathione lyase
MATATKSKAKAKSKAKPAKAKAHAKPKARAHAPAKPKAAAKAAPEAPAYAPPTGPGTFCWRELMTSDVGAASSFYGALFGWTAQDAGLGGDSPYSMWQRGKDGVGGLMPVPQPGVPPHWVSYVEVKDVDASAAKASSLGAKVLFPPFDIPNNHGRCAMLQDPQGATIGIWAAPATR